MVKLSNFLDNVLHGIFFFAIVLDPKTKEWQMRNKKDEKYIGVSFSTLV